MYRTRYNWLGVHSTAVRGHVTVKGIPWIPIYARKYPLADLMGATGMHASPGSLNSFIFMQISVADLKGA